MNTYTVQRYALIHERTGMYWTSSSTPDAGQAYNGTLYTDEGTARSTLSRVNWYANDMYSLATVTMTIETSVLHASEHKHVQSDEKPKREYYPDGNTPPAPRGHA
jgi:hypothetical protein